MLKKNYFWLIVIAAVGIIAAAVGASRMDAPQQQQEQEAAIARQRPQRPQVEVVFVLDTTGSMSGLIQGAKQKIWSIVNEIAKGRPTPEVRLGLVGYRDRGDRYVTTRVDLTNDLDAVYEKLMGFSADGGGDTPESVNQALHEAVHQMSWSSDRRTLKVVFLVGDAPPHMDYAQDVRYQDTCRQAVRKDIIINTIQCGTDADTRRTWNDIAHGAEGTYVAIAQSGGTVAIATPYDRRLTELSAKLDSTYLAYGSSGERGAAKARLARGATVAASAAPEAAAARASFRALAAPAAPAKGDLLGAVEGGGLALDKLADNELPDEMQGLSATERTAYLQKKKSEREQIQQQIAALSKERDEYVKQEMAKQGGAKDAFDTTVIEAIRSKAAKKGISY
ncbi:MAG: VWA domain-containing protein [Deltaproteobacteria bacterium]|nr:VWA domain-containing protein [Deltaproteobacteria bacterium]